MNIPSIHNLSSVSTYDSASRIKNIAGSNVEAFDNVLQSAMKMLKETSSLTNKAEEEALNFAMGKSTSTHDLAIAQQKALTAVQYTVAVRNAVTDAYKEIMQLQF